MSEKFPEEEELVVATVKDITRFGAYLKLEDYPYTAFLPISEVSTRWIRKIDDVIRVGERVVVKVIRVDKKTKSVDVSLKDVSLSERRLILAEWEKNRKGRKLIEVFCKKFNLKVDEFLKEIENLRKDEETIYDALERLIINSNAMKKLKIPDELREKFYEFLSKRVKPKVYVYKAVISASFKGKGGIYRIKELLSGIEEEAKKAGINVKITLIASPRYLVKFSSYLPETIRRNADKIIELSRKKAEELGVKYDIIEKGIQK